MQLIHAERTTPGNAQRLIHQFLAVVCGQAFAATQVPFAAGSTGTPIRVTSLIWRDPDNGPTPVVLGRFTSGATIRRLAIDPATEATWAAATELGIDAVQTRLDTTVALVNAG